MNVKTLFPALVMASTLSFLFISSQPRQAYAALESPATNQDLTSLSTITTTTTNVPDPTFQKVQAKYQKQSVTSTTGWVGYARQGGRKITLTFPRQVDVHHMQITMRQDAQAGIYLPKDVKFEVREGKDWYAVGTQKPTISEDNQKDQTETFHFNSNLGVEGSAVRISFPVGVFVFARGLEVTGNTTWDGQYVSWNKNELVPPQHNDLYALSGATGNDYGIDNMLLVSTGAYGKLGTWTEQDFWPMVGYVNPEGYVNTGLFNTMLFTPYSKVHDTVKGWTNYLNDLFAPDQQLSALNVAVGKSNRLDTLYRPGFKEKVVLNIPYFPIGKHDFGTVNGTDLNFAPTPQDPTAMKARSTALQWYLNQVLARWQQADFQHLKLVGLYWNDEQMHVTDPAEVQLLYQAENTAQQNFLPIFWIPFYGANEESKWKSLGFNAAWIQPNYIEQGKNAQTSRIQDAIATAQNNGMGIEVELTSLKPLDAQLYNTFLEQLTLSHFDGNNVSHVFYDGSKLLVKAANSSNPQQRAIYDKTAAFINGAFTQPNLMK